MLRKKQNGGATNPSNTTTATSSSAPDQGTGGTVHIDRYQHDLQMAQAMRRGMEKRKKEIDQSDVLLGLDGLDQAQALREKGDFQQALKISELSLELLIEFLKSDASVLPTVSRETVGARVESALTGAEEIKRILKTRQQTTTTTGPSLQPQQATKKTTVSSASQALSEALGGTAKKFRNDMPAQTAGQSTASPVRSTQLAASQPRHPKQQTASPFYHSQDPMVKTIKSELYVDQSQLHTGWDDIAGLKDAKQKMQEAAILPLARPDLFTGLRKPRNILLYGPPGTGKTLLVKAVAKESQCLLFICTASSLTSKWHGEGEKLLRTLFQVARAAAPSIIFVDEMDALLSSRKSDGEHEASRRFKTEFMTQVDGIVKDAAGTTNDKHLLLIACTNCPWDIDSAVLRRFPTRIYIPLPDRDTRKALLENILPKAGKHNLSSKQINAIAKKLHGFSGSDITSIASEASFGPLRSLGGMDAIRGAKEKDIRPISVADFETAIDSATKSVSKELLRKYDDWKADQAAT